MIIGLFLKGIKAYKNVTFVPIKKGEFIAYIGKNGVGKSSIIEALDCFFNQKNYSIHKDIRGDDIPYVIPIFLIKKSRILAELSQEKKEIRDELIEQFERLSNLFWDLEKSKLPQGSINVTSEFFSLRSQLLDFRDDYYFFAFGEEIKNDTIKQSIGTFQHYDTEDPFFEDLIKKQAPEIAEKKKRSERNNKWLNFLRSIKDLYSYIYIPVENDVENFTKLETREMQKIIGKTLKNKISEILGATTKMKEINKELDLFVKKIEETLGNDYAYKTGNVRNNKLTQNDLTNKILESYFQKRVLHKQEKKVRDLSSGEKKKTLIDIAYAFLLKEERDKFVVLAMDEPEASLHTNACFEQFEKLFKISQYDDTQVFVTTHWYGFLPILSHGYGHFLSSQDDEKIGFETYDLYNYRSEVKREKTKQENRGQIPRHSELKGVNDLVQSIFYSLYGDNQYNWLLVEGISDKIYCEYFFKELVEDSRLKILPLGGNSEVKKIFTHLNLSLKEFFKNEKILGKVFCLVDTDPDDFGCDISQDPSLKRVILFKRFCHNKSDDLIELIDVEGRNRGVASIENALDPEIFVETMESMNSDLTLKIRDKQGNTTGKNLSSYELEDFFNENSGKNKVSFAKKYIEIFKNKNSSNYGTSKWVEEIKSFFAND